MTPAERWRRHLNFLALAEQHSSAGYHMEEAEMLWGALSQLIIIVAMQRGEPYQEHQHRRHTVRNLAREFGDPFIMRAFGYAQRLHIHFYLGNIDAAIREEARAESSGLRDFLTNLIADDARAG